MKRTFTIKAMYETTEGYYMKYADGYQSICDKDYNDINPEELVGADATDMNIFVGDNTKAIHGLVSDKEAVERMIDNETYTREEWEALSAEEKDNAIEDYLIEEEAHGNSYGERHVEWHTLAFTIDDDAKITNVEIKRNILKSLFISVEREGYTPSQVDSPISVGELINELRNYDNDTKVILSFDGGYTYGTIKIDCIYD